MRFRRWTAVLAVAVALVATIPSAAQGAPRSSRPNVVGVTAADGARVVSQRWLGNRTVDIKVRAPRVRQAPIPVRVILPAGFSTRSKRTYPVAYLLHGGNDNYTSWTRNVDVGRMSAKYGVITVMPDAGRNAVYTNYLRPYQGNPLQWMTFHTVELPQIIERGFKANHNRAIAGISSGGYGSFAYATQNPGMFRYAAEFSGPIAIRLPIVRTALMMSSGDTDPYVRWGIPLLEEQNWELRDPLTMAANLRGTGLYLSSGQTGLPNNAIGDRPWGVQQIGEFYAGTFGAAFSSRLQQLGIPATTHFYPLGEHSWPSWRREFAVAWPLMLKSLGARRI